VVELAALPGRPAVDLSLVADAAKNFVVIMKDGTVVKNQLR
jgi:hypothetical protein